MPSFFKGIGTDPDDRQRFATSSPVVKSMTSLHFDMTPGTSTVQQFFAETYLRKKAMVIAVPIRVMNMRSKSIRIILRLALAPI